MAKHPLNIDHQKTGVMKEPNIHQLKVPKTLPWTDDQAQVESAPASAPLPQGSDGAAFGIRSDLCDTVTAASL